MHNPTRRVVLAGAAALPSLGALAAPSPGAMATDPAVAAWIRWDASLAALNLAPEDGDAAELANWTAAEAALADAVAVTPSGILAKLDVALVDIAADDDFSQSDKRALLTLAAAVAEMGAALPGGPRFVRSRTECREAGSLPSETMIAGLFPVDGGRA